MQDVGVFNKDLEMLLIQELAPQHRIGLEAHLILENSCFKAFGSVLAALHASQMQNIFPIGNI